MKRLKQLFEYHDAIVLVDCETTGLDANTDHIIELAAIKVEKDFQIAKSFDYFLKLPNGVTLSNNITNITGITGPMLQQQGKSFDFVTEEMENILKSDGVTLMVAHNAQFDLQFISKLLRGRTINKVTFLDTLTIYKDRSAPPHKLSNAIKHYGLEGKVQNSHRAIDDVKALLGVLLGMEEERDDLIHYINLFGYPAKYGINGRKINGVTYAPQQTIYSMCAPHATLPNLIDT